MIIDVELLKPVATTLVLIAAVTIIAFPQRGLRAYPFFVFLAGHGTWAVFAILMKEWSLFAMNGGFVLLDIYGILIRLYPNFSLRNIRF